MDNNLKNKARLRKVRKIRAHIKQLRVDRLSIHKTSRHIYAQVISANGGIVLASASTLDKDFAGKITSNITAATLIGKAIAEKAVKAGLKKVAFDRAGFRYHGRVKALAEAARESGLEF